MNTIRKNIVIALAALGIAGASLGVQAQGPATPQEHHAKRAEQRAARHAALHDALELSPAQQPRWQAFVASTMPPTERDRASQRLSKEQRHALSAPQRLERRIARHKQRTARMEARLAAMNSLYASLTPAQRKVFDERKRGHGGRHHGGHGMLHG
ncbi:Spy/CpxP family protein refolding chaperone [Massilia sp. H6]|uniref:Spy/CpxP family protein refolding chaperone n=1 Tax=Massilia sp. H6 TaxID=2970464 RepID=UPI00216913B7|nr:Spy/CpxP family protein refolding chaperone [Massilia sp. H6]UVW29105.1 Spy/CpxP family protein refolding chaperone [Massilia sp. H6]